MIRNPLQQARVTAPPGPPPFEVAYQPGWEIIRTRIRAFWSSDTPDDYFAALIPAMTDQRRHFARARVLVDRRGGVPQSPETLARTIAWFDKAYMAGDASAIVVDSSLLKLQLRRVYPADRANLFLSYSAAETWLRSR